MSSNVVTSMMLIAAICITIGYVFGWLVASLRGSHAHDKEEALAKTADPGDGPRPLLQLNHDPENGALRVTLIEKTVRKADGLTQEERRQVANLLQEAIVWLGVIPAPAAVSAPAAAASTLATAAPDPVSTPDLARPSVINGVTTVIADVINPIPPKKEGPKSIVQQIDEILQDKLAGTALETEKIFLTEDPRVGVIVRVGSEMYEGIGALPEGEIKTILKACVQEWERRQEVPKRRP